MPIPPGRRLGPYEILSAIGAGGMGEVYKARDTRLDRIVAIKVLPTHLANRSELRERFEREARVVASLNHPHICTLYDIGQQDGIDFLVMEYLEGETLAQRLLKGQLPLEQVLQYAIEIADALDKAHRRGITHRDLKPGNIMLTKSGTKLLDFGLAKLRQEASPTVPFSQLPTAKDAITAQGTILGTLQYMAPEQVEGKVDKIDGRTDIFAFGALIYEMATGQKAFEGKTTASLMAKILETEPPPISSLQPMTPPTLDRVVRTCLAKDPDQRWQSAGDLCRELKWIAESGSQVAAGQVAARAGSLSAGNRRLTLAAGILSLAAVVAGLVIWRLRPATEPVPQPVSRLTITLPPGQQLAGTDFGSPVALSRDGTHLAYVAHERGASQQLYLRSMDRQEASPISGTQGAVTPFFSPDGQSVIFSAGGKWQKVSVNGGTAVTLADSPLPAGASWSSEGVIGLGDFRAPILQVPAAGGTTQPLTRLEGGDTGHTWPEFLPGGKSVLFAMGTDAKPQIAVQSLTTGERRNLVSGIQPRYATSGHLIYAQGGTLMAVAFDPQRLQIIGAAVPMVQDVAESPIYFGSQYSISDNGSLAYISGGAEAIRRSLVWLSRSGAEQPLPAPPRAYGSVRFSPDGRRVAVDVDQQIWIYDLVRDSLTRLTFESSLNRNPVWTPDGKRIVFQSNKETVEYNVWWQLADGSGGLERLTKSDYADIPKSFSPDGQLLAFNEINPKTQKDLWVLRLSDRKAQPFLQTPFMEVAPTFSPDGRWLAYVSDESGRPEVYVQTYPAPGGKWQISTEGGTEPVWNRNGRELFFRSGNKMMAADVTAQPGFSAGKPRKLFEGSYVRSDWPLATMTYDVSADGQRFLMVKETEQASAATQINIVQNWFEELKQKVPTGKK
ncbi:MAG: serine/threonine-protein kinase [Acidobacteriia bacterium]|nr:serine/threonine-protein kinase [Terriglobia bacterium]